MGTNATVCRATDGGWEGRMVHFDGYPTGVGIALLEGYKVLGLERLAALLIDEHPAGWSGICAVDWTVEPGFGGDGPACYCHGEESERGGKRLTNRDSSIGSYRYQLEPAGVRVFFSYREEEALVAWDDPELMRRLEKRWNAA